MLTSPKERKEEGNEESEQRLPRRQSGSGHLPVQHPGERKKKRTRINSCLSPSPSGPVANESHWAVKSSAPIRGNKRKGNDDGEQEVRKRRKQVTTNITSTTSRAPVVGRASAPTHHYPPPRLYPEYTQNGYTSLSNPTQPYFQRHGNPPDRHIALPTFRPMPSYESSWHHPMQQQHMGYSQSYPYPHPSMSLPSQAIPSHVQIHNPPSMIGGPATYEPFHRTYITTVTAPTALSTTVSTSQYRRIRTPSSLPSRPASIASTAPALTTPSPSSQPPPLSPAIPTSSKSDPRRPCQSTPWPGRRSSSDNSPESGKDCTKQVRFEPVTPHHPQDDDDHVVVRRLSLYQDDWINSAKHYESTQQATAMQLALLESSQRHSPNKCRPVPEYVLSPQCHIIPLCFVPFEKSEDCRCRLCVRTSKQRRRESRRRDVDEYIDDDAFRGNDNVPLSKAFYDLANRPNDISNDEDSADSEDVENVENVENVKETTSVPNNQSTSSSSLLTGKVLRKAQPKSDHDHQVPNVPDVNALLRAVDSQMSRQPTASIVQHAMPRNRRRGTRREPIQVDGDSDDESQEAATPPQPFSRKTIPLSTTRSRFVLSPDSVDSDEDEDGFVVYEQQESDWDGPYLPGNDQRSDSDEGLESSEESGKHEFDLDSPSSNLRGDPLPQDRMLLGDQGRNSEQGWTGKEVACPSWRIRSPTPVVFKPRGDGTPPFVGSDEDLYASQESMDTVIGTPAGSQIHGEPKLFSSSRTGLPRRFGDIPDTASPGSRSMSPDVAEEENQLPPQNLEAAFISKQLKTESKLAASPVARSTTNKTTASSSNTSTDKTGTIAVITHTPAVGFPTLALPVSREGGLAATIERLIKAKENIPNLLGASIFLNPPKKSVVKDEALSPEEKAKNFEEEIAFRRGLRRLGKYSFCLIVNSTC